MRLRGAWATLPRSFVRAQRRRLLAGLVLSLSLISTSHLSVSCVLKISEGFSLSCLYRRRHHPAQWITIVPFRRARSLSRSNDVLSSLWDTITAASSGSRHLAHSLRQIAQKTYFGHTHFSLRHAFSVSGPHPPPAPHQQRVVNTRDPLGTRHRGPC